MKELEYTQRKSQLVKRKTGIHQNDLDQLAHSMRIETTLSKLENKTKGLSTTLEEQNNTIAVLTKENQKLKSELQKFSMKFDEKEQALQKNVSKEASNSVKAINERDELRKELQQIKNNLKVLKIA